MGQARHICVFAGVSTRCDARAGNGTLAAVNAQAVKESQTDLRFMVCFDVLRRMFFAKSLMPTLG